MSTGRRVLVVDDELGIRLLLSETLEMEGFEVSVAEDGQESLDRMAAGDFDLVITDIRMPRVDGIEMIRRMQASGRKEKVIILTGSPLQESFLCRSAPPVVAQLRKPVGMDALLEVVTSTISR
jgi:CheY-like chemotaxis protein